ncbi:Os06g0135000, partial [Oryza sativa Japonica Group]
RIKYLNNCQGTIVLYGAEASLKCRSFWFIIGLVFVQLICAIQYRVVKEHADDAFYELQNPQQQIQAYAFDGKLLTLSN